MFDLSERDWERVIDWVREQDGKVAQKQGRDTPEYGAVGGALTYEFTPTTVGTVVRVRHALTQESLDLTDYEDW